MAQETITADSSTTARQASAPVVTVQPRARPQAATPRLRTLSPTVAARRQEALAVSERYTRFVRWMKIALPIFAVGLVGVVVLYAGLHKPKTGVNFSFSRVSVVDDDLTMISPRFSGTDPKARPFVVTADQARQDAQDPDLVHLTEIQADLELPGVAWLFLNSETGELHTKVKSLKLDGAVNIRSDLGYELTTEALDVDIAAAEAHSRAPVAGTGPIGRLRANHMSIYDEGRKLVFEGRVRTVLRPSRKDDLKDLKAVGEALREDGP